MPDALEIISKFLVVEGLQPCRTGKNCPGRDRQETQEGLWLVGKPMAEQSGEK